MLDNNKLKIELNGKHKYMSYELERYSYTLSLFYNNEYTTKFYSITSKTKISVLIHLVDKKYYNDELYEYRNYVDIPKEHILIIKELIDLFNQLCIIPMMMDDSINTDEYIDISKYL